ncbi:CoA-binding protein [soil metagenome]
MTDDAAGLLARTKTVLLIDWPSRDVPDTLARCGFAVVSCEGPGPEDYNAYEIEGDDVRVRHVGRLPERAELVYAHRPIEELPEIAETAKAVGAKAVWIQSGRDDAGGKDVRGCSLPPEESARAREVVEGAGLAYIEAPYIADAVRAR